MPAGHPYRSWGGYPKTSQLARRPIWRDQLPTQLQAETTLLPFGNGRSYGDVCLNDGGTLIDCRGIDRVIAFDPETGIFRAEAGIQLAEILALSVPHGWFLPATPGTQFVTLGGAVANDVHGKNHHRMGTFGCHVRALELLRSDGDNRVCTPEQNTDWLHATIGGLGLTGLISWVEIQLIPIASPVIDQETIKYERLSDFFALSEESDQSHEYTVAWIDCLAKAEQLGRGHFIRGNFRTDATHPFPEGPSQKLNVPVTPPLSLINGLSLKIFNQAYYHRQKQVRDRRNVHYAPFFYPLDAINNWNRVYGPKGFLQYQNAIPSENSQDAIDSILSTIADSGTGSFLAVLKVFGDPSSPGLLSFPLPGATLALDFPNRGQDTMRLLDRLDAITREAGGRVYPAKDARMNSKMFHEGFPKLETFCAFVDPALSSSFWRRVMPTQPSSP